jgi:hypothetical protein
MKKILSLILILSIVLLYTNSCKPDAPIENDKIPLQDYQYWYIFKQGSYWIYQNSKTGDIDSVYLTSSLFDYQTTKINVAPRPYYIDEYYNISFFKSSFFNKTFNLWSINTHMLKNGDLSEKNYHKGQIIKRGDPNNINSINVKYNGCLYVSRSSSINIGSNIFNDIEQMKIIHNEQTQIEFEYDTDIYFAKNIGIIKKEINDTIEGTYSWNLIRWHINQ